MKAKRDKLLSPEEARTLIDKNMSEKSFLTMVIEYAKSQRWLVYHVLEQTAYARRTSKGLPDLIMGRITVIDSSLNVRLVVAELKSQTGRLAPNQEQWGRFFNSFAHVCVLGYSRACEYYVWRPSDWPTIERVLARETDTGKGGR